MLTHVNTTNATIILWIIPHTGGMCFSVCHTHTCEEYNGCYIVYIANSVYSMKKGAQYIHSFDEKGGYYLLKVRIYYITGGMMFG